MNTQRLACRSAALLLTTTVLVSCAGEPRATPSHNQPPRVVRSITTTEHREVTRDNPNTDHRTDTHADARTTHAASTPVAPALTDPPGTITLDGDTRDWPAATVALSTPEHAFFRFMVADQRYTLQAADHTTVIMLDADNDAATGKPVTLGDATLGVDIEAQFSPMGESGKLQRGTTVLTYDGPSPTRANAYDWDLACTPTYASDWYEARITRTPRTEPSCTKKGLLSSGTSRGVVATLDTAGTPDAWSPVFALDNPPAKPETGANAAIPEKPEHAVRVVSYNVLRSSPNAKPQVFQRILGALQPDIVLVQEWESHSESEIADWFNSMMPDDKRSWNIVAIADTVQNGGGVAVVSRYPLHAALDARPTVPAGVNAGKPIRAAVAIADAPSGPIILSSTHLKSGGASGSPEDVRRTEEARALNAIISAKAPAGAWRIIAGDMNLVGSREPIDILTSKLDADHSDLSPAPTRTLGDATYLTWSENGNAFTPGRLDWLLYSDSNARAANAFVLDTSRLSDESLSRAGLTTTDTAQATDHMPLVVDLVAVK